MARVMKWDGFNMIQPQNLTTVSRGYGDLAPSLVINDAGLRIIRGSSSPNSYIETTTAKQKRSVVHWNDLQTVGTGNQKNTGGFQVRFWFYASTDFKNVPSGYHYRFARTYDTDYEWVHCLCYRGKDLLLRVGNKYGNTDIVAKKNALSDSGWANKWHRIELSCNNAKQHSAVKIDKGSWVRNHWSYDYVVNHSNKVKLQRLAIGSYEDDSPGVIAYRNVEIIDNHIASNFTYDWQPPVGPSFNLPTSMNLEQLTETANVVTLNTSLGDAPIKEARWYRTWKPKDATFVSRTPIKTENVNNTALANFNYVGGPYNAEGTDKIDLVVTDMNNITVSKTVNVYVGASPDTGPTLSTSDKTILAGAATTVNITALSAGSNGATFKANQIVPGVLEPYNATNATEEEIGNRAFLIVPSDSNPDSNSYNYSYTQEPTMPGTLLAIQFSPFTAPGDYSYKVIVQNSKDVASEVSFNITVQAIDTPVWTFNTPEPPNEFDEIPEYFVGSEFPIDIEIDTGNAGAPTYLANSNTTWGTEFIGGTIKPYLDHYKFTAQGVVTSQEDINGFSIGIIDAYGNSSVSPAIYYNARTPIAPTIDLTDDFLVNATVTPSFTIQAFVTDGTFALDPNTYQWQVLTAPTGYDGLLAFDTYALTFSNYDTQGTYAFEYRINDVEGNMYTAVCHVFISMGAIPADKQPRDILDWMSNTQLEQEATKALSGIVLRGNNKQDIEWYRRQVLSLQIPNIGTMSFEEVERQYYKAIINGDLYRENGIYGTIDGGTPDDIIVDDSPELPDDTDSDDPTEPPIVPDPTHPPVTPPTPVEITYDFVVQLQHNVRRVLQSFAWDQPRNVWFGAQVNPDSTSDTLIYKFDATGQFLGTMNMLDAGHGSSIAHQRVGTADYIWTYHSAIGIDEGKSIVRAKYTNGSSVTINDSDVQRTPTFYSQYSPVNIYNEYITVVTRVSGKDTFRQYKINDYLAGKNNPIRVRTVSINSSMGAYQGHTADEKYIYVARGGSSYDTAKPNTLWDKSHVMIYRWSDGKAWDINTTAVGMDVASGRSESEGIQRYDVGGVKTIFIGKATGKTSARVHKVYKFTRDKLEDWIKNG